jgi:hypothetical protein
MIRLDATVKLDIINCCHPRYAHIGGHTGAPSYCSTNACISSPAYCHLHCKGNGKRRKRDIHDQSMSCLVSIQAPRDGGRRWSDARWGYS